MDSWVDRTHVWNFLGKCKFKILGDGDMIADGMQTQNYAISTYLVTICHSGGCKGVRCPPIFSLSNLIAGTNRKAYLLHASFALKDSHCQWSSITDFTVVQQLMPEHLHTYELS